ncbi:prefoldin subunit 5 [Odontomachus brunneus]|uniref:prefoldin subunit 5 n=1 Tax=Odontomachus brunneus TaxID=486640 RepID=UPI0013F1E5CE|nr:prefoldin subunit 5 [Odontomachus brunneus]XP_032684076.1 prefoldin subunit 5 [Odontomachus brunneus]
MSQISMKPGPQLQKVDLTSLNLQQLTMLKQQLDQELGLFQDSLHTLKIAQSRFQESGACLEKITPAAQGNEILVPLTSSMYVTGKLADANNVLVDIGTGYYAEKGIEDAKDYFKRRVEYVTEQMEKIQQLGVEKNKMREATMDVMEMKIHSQMQKENAERA